MPAGWTAADLPRQDGRTVLVTGATSGIGLETARELARVGAHVLLGSRDPDKGRAVAQGLPGSVEVQPMDLTDLASLRAFAGRWAGRRLDVLVNNAGVFALPAGRTADGFERQMGTNHLGHFALTNLLLPQLRDRVVVISSLAHRGPQVDVDDLLWQRRRYTRFGAYQQSKLATLLHALELQHRLADLGSRVRVMAAHPGWVRSGLHSHSGNVLLDRYVATAVRMGAQSAAQGAWPALLAATADVPSGAYLGPAGRGERTGHPVPVARSEHARDRTAARALWARSAELTRTDFPHAERS